MNTELAEWLKRRNPVMPVNVPKQKRNRQRKPKMTVALVKSTWAACIVPDEMDCEMIDWLIARCEKLELRLQNRGKQHG